MAGVTSSNQKHHQTRHSHGDAYNEDGQTWQSALEQWPALKRWSSAYLCRKAGAALVTVDLTPSGRGDAVAAVTAPQQLAPHMQQPQRQEQQEQPPPQQEQQQPHRQQEQQQEQQEDGAEQQAGEPRLGGQQAAARSGTPPHSPSQQWFVTPAEWRMTCRQFFALLRDSRCSAGAHTPGALCADHYENMYAVVRGTKSRVPLPPPRSLLQRPGLSGPLVARVGPGELLYLPALWYHQVSQLPAGPGGRPGGGGQGGGCGGKAGPGEGRGEASAAQDDDGEDDDGDDDDDVVMAVNFWFERFTEKAIKVVMLAQEEARRLGHNFVGTEQLLLGLIGESTGIAAKVLKSMGVNLKDARVEVEKIIGRGSGFVAVEIPFTPRAKRVLEMSLEEARQLGHNYIGTEHILLGLLREGEGVAARVLETLSADPAKIRTQARPAPHRFQPVVVPEPSIDETFEILQLPEEARDLDKELKQVTKDKDAAVRGQDFEKAGQLRDREMELKAKIQAILAGAKEQSKAEAESVEGAGPHGDRAPSPPVPYVCMAWPARACPSGPQVTEQDIANIVAQWTGIPVEKVSSDETERLIKMEEVLHGRVIGQEEAVSAISRAIRRARVGLKSPSRPIASFIFAGPTGVGKSELAKTLANYYFGSEEAMVRLDMSEFMERHTVSKLIGSPPGYVGYSEGGQLTEAVRRRPYTVVLFDEIEKAHPDVFNMMLQILEDGRLTDSKGRTVDFKNTLIIMTSNVGSSVIEKGGRNFGFFLRPDDEEAEDVSGVEKEGDMSYGRIKSLVGEELKSYFRPEFLNRLDEIIVFRQLTKKEVKQIADIFLKDVFKRAQEKGIKIEVTDKFKDRLVDEGFNPTYGARPLRRAIMRLIEDCLAERILTGDIKDGDVVIMDVDPDGSIAVLAGDKKMRTAIDATPAGIA
ncbi:hypothetical protein QJQ45_016506 [Haematococcus lacustris]|nr:hypothetical protein QJQ45_016506 [Haematococcus lacustris]